MANFGEMAAGLGYVPTDSVEEALALQQQEAQENRPHRRIGAIFQEMGYIQGWTVDVVLECQNVVREWDGKVCGVNGEESVSASAAGERGNTATN